MQNLIFKLLVVTAVSLLGWVSVHAEELMLIGKIPGEYFRGQDKNQFTLGYVLIEDEVIKEVKAIKDINDLPKGSKNLIVLKNKKTGRYDAIYPGLIDLHNHAKANVLPVWDHAHGQFSNRFEWRSNSNYQKSVSSNMNLWVNADSALTCASYRWNELQAMALGTTYLQGSRACDSNFSILRVENPDNYKNSDKDEVKAPTDLVMPADMVFVWNTLKPIMEENQYNYEQAMAYVLRKYCPSMPHVTDDHVKNPGMAYDLINGKEIVDQEERDSGGKGTFMSSTKLTNKAWVTQYCGAKEDLPPKFTRYMYFVHKTVASKKLYLDQPNYSSYIVHLGEGRRDDPYNQIEFEIVQLLGLNRKGVSFVHGLGLSKDEMKYMARLGMGLVWSPYSNLLLYGQTLDFNQIDQAEKEAGKKIPLALGSDWTPTGTKSVLEELKLAREYMIKKEMHGRYNDEDLYNMVTTGPAKIINHEGEVGTIRKDAMGSLIVATILDENPYTNLVAKVWERDINLVVVNGEAIYGNESYIRSVHKGDAEDITRYVGSMSDWVDDLGNVKFASPEGLENPDSSEYLVLAPVKFERSEDKKTYAKGLGVWAANNKDKFENSVDACGFDEKKLFIYKQSGDRTVEEYKSQTGLDLDKMFDIQSLVAIGLMTQSRNIHDRKNGKVGFRAKYFPPLLSCADDYQRPRLVNFVQSNPTEGEDEYTENLKNASDAQKMCEKFDVCRN